MAILLALAVIAALIVTNFRISGRPAVSANEVNGIVDPEGWQRNLQIQSESSVAARRGVPLRRIRDSGGRVAAIGALHSDDFGNSDRHRLCAATSLTALHGQNGGRTSIKVTFADGTVSSASVKTADPADDIAVLTPARLPSVIAPEVLGAVPQIGDQTVAGGTRWAWMVLCPQASSRALIAHLTLRVAER